MNRPQGVSMSLAARNPLTLRWSAGSGEATRGLLTLPNGVENVLGLVFLLPETGRFVLVCTSKYQAGSVGRWSGNAEAAVSRLPPPAAPAIVVG